ncbi:MAG: hypothetical protein DRO40_00725 [Thermoprotei archaeon]|nr:MAG: hypothetical protein DRO40_00725 [Thermoprotei archaeon]
MRLSLDDAVLVLILMGYDTVDSIADALRVDYRVIENVVNKLRVLDLVHFEEKGFWIFKKKVLRLTKEGFEKAIEIRDKITSVAEKVRRDIEKGAGLEELAEIYGYALPLLALMGFIDFALITPLLGLLAFDMGVDGIDTEVM